MSEATRAQPAAAASPPPPQEPTLTMRPPPPAPRGVTPEAARRAWHEPRVHFWWIVALGLIVAACWIAVMQLVAWNHDARLIRGGTRVDAVVWLSGARLKGRPIGPENTMSLEFTLNGNPVQLTEQRLVGRDAPTQSGDVIPIYVDPKDHRNWTPRSTPPSLLKLMAGALALVGLAVLLALVSALKRRGVLSTWRNGDARQAAVVETSQSALAPRSRLVRCALADGTDKRLITVYVPHRVAVVQPGDGLWLVMPPGRPDKALAAASFGVA